MEYLIFGLLSLVLIAVVVGVIIWLFGKVTPNNWKTHNYSKGYGKSLSSAIIFVVIAIVIIVFAITLIV